MVAKMLCKRILTTCTSVLPCPHLHSTWTHYSSVLICSSVVDSFLFYFTSYYCIFYFILIHAYLFLSRNLGFDIYCCFTLSDLFTPHFHTVRLYFSAQRVTRADSNFEELFLYRVNIARWAALRQSHRRALLDRKSVHNVTYVHFRAPQLLPAAVFAPAKFSSLLHFSQLWSESSDPLTIRPCRILEYSFLLLSWERRERAIARLLPDIATDNFMLYEQHTLK